MKLIKLVLLFGILYSNFYSQTNTAPVVNAGPNQTLTLPNTASLSGTATDDGLPNPPGALSITWSQVSGPVGATFGNPNSLNTSAMFPSPGTYTLRLSVSDGSLTTTDDIVVTANRSSGPNQQPIMSAGPDKVITLPTNSVTLNGFATDDGLPNPPGSLNITWSQLSGPTGVTFSNTKTPTTTATFPSSATYRLRLRVTDGLTIKFDTVQVIVNPVPPNTAPTVNAGIDQNITLPVNSVTLNGSASDDGFPNPPGALTTSWAQISGPAGVTIGNPAALSTTATFPSQGTYKLTLTANDSQLSKTDTVQIIVNPPANTAPVVNAGTDQNITLPTNSVTLNGTATDDGLPNPPGTLTTAWAQISGPAGVTFGNSAALSTSASFPSQGTYLLRLTANDGQLSKSDTLQIIVNAGNNTAPVVNAGPNQTLTLPSQASLSGTATDDGLPFPPGALTITWTQISGPVGATFASPNTLNTTVMFPSPGTYTLRLSVNDGALTSTDDIVVTANRSSGPNQQPIMSAGPDKSITLPTNSVVLNGFATDDGLPNPPGSLNITWSQLSGPTGVTFSNTKTPTTTATFPSAATYRLRLRVTDGLTILFDTVQVVVNPAGATNTAPVVNAGSDQSITLPTNSTTLNGSATDDGLPNPPAALTVSWAQISGPAGVTFGNGTALSTSATFPSQGTYNLTLTANDSQLSKTDTVQIIVNPPGNTAPVVNAGTDQNITLPTNSVTLNGSATDDGLPNPPGTLTKSWAQISGPAGVTFGNASALSTTATFPSQGTYKLTLTANDSQLSKTDTVQIIVNPSGATNTAPIVNAGLDQTITLPNQATLSGSASDDGLPNPPHVLTITWSQVSGPVGATFANPNSLNTTAMFPSPGTYTLRLSASDGSLTSTDDIVVIANRSTGTNQQPIMSAGPDKSTTLPVNTVTLSGFATDDGLPNPPGSLNITWSQISGPAGVTFANNKNPGTTATFPSAATFRLQLRVSDGATIKLDTVQVIVSPATNTAPVIDAGPNLVLLPPATSLQTQATATDDGLPNNTLTFAWSTLGGPGTVSFSNANILNPTITLSIKGTYKLKLIVSDGVLASTDSVIINFTSAPVVNAGLNQQITMPLDSVLITATATDDTLPNPPGKMTFLWSKDSGPGTVTFRKPDSLNTIVKFSLPGTYQLRFTAFDGAISSFDQIFIVVKPSPALPASLKTIPAPGPQSVPGFDFTQFIVNNDAAIKLGKAMFWDMQVGSDGKVACATCHFHAGADGRSKNELHPGASSTTFFTGRGPNYQLQLSDFPFSTVKSNDDVVGSQGVVNTSFNDIVLGSDVESGTLVADNIFNVNSINTRRTTKRNSPTVINAVYTYRNFWDGRANPIFNGVNPFGQRDQSAFVFKVIGSNVVQAQIAIPLSSLASQAAGPPLDHTEMSYDGRRFMKLGKKLLHLKPLQKQLVSPTDSKLGSMSRSPLLGLDTTISYASLIQQAFNSQWWNSNKIVTFSGSTATVSDPPGTPLTTDQFTVMEANFALFWGLAIQAYEQTLVSNDSKFDKFREGTATLTSQEQNGLNLFMGKGRCISCHSGPEFTNASVTAKNTQGAIDRMIMKDGEAAIYDIGFYNIGVRATNEDLGVGSDLSGFPLSFSKQVTVGPQADTFSVNTNNFHVPGPIVPGERITINGAFKVPSLRNVELTGPYFHNGGKATLKELLIAYNAGNLFRNENVNDMPPDITVLNLAGSEEDAIIAFLLTLTDDRVRNESAPFDHPELIIPNGHPGDQTSVTNDGTGKATDDFLDIPAVGSSGGTPLTAFLGGNPFLGKGGFEGGEENVDKQIEIPKDFALLQNFPNPFNPTTKIRYSLPFDSNVNLIIYNMLGQEVVRLVDQLQPSGNYEINWNANNLASGVYIYRLEARVVGKEDQFVSVKKMLLVK